MGNHRPLGTPLPNTHSVTWLLTAPGPTSPTSGPELAVDNLRGGEQEPPPAPWGGSHYQLGSCLAVVKTLGGREEET